MDYHCLPFIKSSKTVKRFGEAESEEFNSGYYAPNRQRSTKPLRHATQSMQDLPSPGALLTKSSGKGSRKRSRDSRSGIEQHLAQLKRKQNEFKNDTVFSHDVSMNSQLTEYCSTQEVPSSPELKRARNSSPFFTHDNFYEVSVEHDWEEAPVDVVVPRVTVRRKRKEHSSSTDNQDLFHGENQFLQLLPRFTESHKVSAPNHRQCVDNHPHSSNTMLNILPHEE